MTEIKIEKKKPVWPWVLLGVVILGLGIIYLLAYDDDREVPVVENRENTEVSPATDPNAEVTTYIILIENDVDSMGLSHEFTNEAFMTLIQATSYTADKNDVNIKVELDTARKYATQIQTDPFDTSHANKIHQAAEILTSALEKIQQAKYPALSNEANELSSSVASINPDTPTLEQKTAVKSFFRKAADLLRKMNT